MRGITVTTSLIAALVAGCVSAPQYDPYLHERQISIKIVSGYASFNRDYLYSGHSEEDLIASAKTAVSNGLKDPQSAQFRNVRLVAYQEGAVVCGEVNGKNSYGGFTGFKRFAATSEAALIDQTSSNQADARSLGIYEACSG
ncbi:hypothetical protein [Delftia lacustris]|uniref:Lipoprotein n=1 Tax=Delftia lacustris TaxID=558537 RepID=A0A1H3TGK3_9BURK|nr:hypothetical protein [Delftia lacustris]SDZ49364.1 hypothetical protein SAMN05421547_12866 [Delftia lacustris]